jgi:hypothetical protein
MKKRMLMGTVVLLALILGLATLYAQPLGPRIRGQGSSWGSGYSPQQTAGWYSRFCGAWRRGFTRSPGRMGAGWHRGSGWGRGYGMTPGMMSPGHGYGSQYQQSQNRLER